MARRRKPVKPATVRGWERYNARHLNTIIGDTPLANMNNSTLKGLVAKLADTGLSPKSIRIVVQVITAVMASAVNEEGEAIYPRKWNYDFADVPIVGNQRTPMFTGENVAKIIAEAENQARVVFALFAASGQRAGELFGLEVKHFAGNTVTVDQSVWEGHVQAPKTKNTYREVDLHPSVADLVRAHVGNRKDGFIFQTEEGTSMHQSNFLCRNLHPILEKLGFEKQGFHGFRRFRVTHLESNVVAPALVRYWTGHAKSSDREVVKQTVADKYVMMT